MNINDAFQSKYLKSSDIQGVVPVQIVGVTMEDVGTEGQPEHKAVLHLHGSKPMILNRTNARTLADMLGDETDGWTGKRIHLFVTSVDFRGSVTKGLRIAPAPVEHHVNPMPGPPTAPQAVPDPEPQQSHWLPDDQPKAGQPLPPESILLSDDQVQQLQTELAKHGKAESALLEYLGKDSVWAITQDERSAAWGWITRP